MLLQSFFHVSTVLLGVDLREHVQCLHADLHPGLEKARLGVLSGCRRVSDWSHVVGANRAAAAKQDDAAPHMKVWRRGIMKNAQEAMAGGKEQPMRIFEEVIHLCRCLPRGPFSLIIMMLLQYLENLEPPETKVAQLLRKHYVRAQVA